MHMFPSAAAAHVMPWGVIYAMHAAHTQARAQHSLYPCPTSGRVQGMCSTTQPKAFTSVSILTRTTQRWVSVDTGAGQWVLAALHMPPCPAAAASPLGCAGSCPSHQSRQGSADSHCRGRSQGPARGARDRQVQLSECRPNTGSIGSCVATAGACCADLIPAFKVKPAPLRPSLVAPLTSS